MMALRKGERERSDRRSGSDDGSMLPLIAVFVALALALILVVLGTSSLYLERKRLYSLADGAASAGAEAFRLDDAPRDGGRLPPLTPEEVRGAARDYLNAVPASGIESLEIDRADSPDGRSAVIELSGWWRPPIVTAFVPKGIRLSVTATARSVLS